MTAYIVTVVMCTIVILIAEFIGIAIVAASVGAKIAKKLKISIEKYLVSPRTSDVTESKLSKKGIVKTLTPLEEGRKKTTPYSVREISELGIRHSVTISFELAYHDWLILQNSKEFQDLADYLQGLQKKYDLPERH